MKVSVLASLIALWSAPGLAGAETRQGGQREAHCGAFLEGRPGGLSARVRDLRGFFVLGRMDINDYAQAGVEGFLTNIPAIDAHRLSPAQLITALNRGINVGMAREISANISPLKLGYVRSRIHALGQIISAHFNHRTIDREMLKVRYQLSEGVLSLLLQMSNEIHVSVDSIKEIEFTESVLLPEGLIDRTMDDLDGSLSNEQLVALIRRMVSGLDERRQIVFAELIAADEEELVTLTAVAKQLGVTHQRVAQIKKSILTMIRKDLFEQGLYDSKQDGP